MESFFLLLVPLRLSHRVGGPLNSGDGDGDCGFYKRGPQRGFASLQDDLVFSPFVRAGGGLNGDISILA